MSRPIPVSIPDLNDVGEVFGWSAEYNPQRDAPPLDSRMTFTPADFCIGESGIRFFS